MCVCMCVWSVCVCGYMICVCVCVYDLCVCVWLVFRVQDRSTNHIVYARVPAVYVPVRELRFPLFTLVDNYL